LTHLDLLLSVYLDGETTPEESRLVAEHLSQCLRCRRRLETLNQARTAVRSLPMLEMPAHLVPATGSPREARRWHPGRWVAAAAALATIVTATALALPDPEPLDLNDVTRQVGARAALDLGANSFKFVIPGSER
jgi:anti-sigma factor RsiW